MIGLIGMGIKLFGSIGGIAKAKHSARAQILSSWAGVTLSALVFITYLYVTYLIWYGIEAPGGVDFMLAFRYELLTLFSGIMGLSAPNVIKGIKVKSKDVAKMSKENADKKKEILNNVEKPSINGKGLEIVREYKKKYTPGKIFYNGQETGIQTLELRAEVDGVPNVSGKCCILEGEYPIQYLESTASGKTYKGLGCFWIQNVLNRSGILIHIGNYLNQIQGCILVGDRVLAGGSISGSKKAFKKLKALIEEKNIQSVRIVS